MTNIEKEKRFDWPLCYEAESYILGHLAAFTARHRCAHRLAGRMRDEAGTLLLDWVDHLVLPANEEKPLLAAGYVLDPAGEAPANQRQFWHPEAMLPLVLLDRAAGADTSPPTLAIRCESVSDFLAAHQLNSGIEGTPLSPFRRAVAGEENGARLCVVERRGYRGCVPVLECNSAGQLLEATEAWHHRPRQFEDDAAGLRHTQAVLDRMIALVGRDLACHAVFAGERAYWERRNRAARVQKARQDRLGLGWANHDHHTFRCSRRHFVDLMRVLEKLGFERRERFYAGEQAGWGAQILEQPIEGIIAFCDVDLQPDETEIDFSREPLPPVPKLGTIGLWVGLHGESLLDAGLHHLECRFDHALLREQLAGEGVNTMKPFSDFPFLQQAFTEGERWPVRRERAERLRAEGLIDEKQCQQFTNDGAIGSHLENLQRRGGFKGFNQKSVSVIITATDPRLQAGH